MSPADKKSTNLKSGGFKPGIFMGLTALAVVMVVILVTLGRISAHPSEPVAMPIFTPPASTSVPPKTTNISPIKTGTFTTTPAPTMTYPAVNIVTSMGSATAPVTILEYSEFQCAHCQQFALTIEPELEQTYVATGKVRVIYRFITAYEESQKANEAAACAAEQGQFWPYYYLLMQQKASPTTVDLPIEKLQSLAVQLGLNMTQFNSSLLSGKFESRVKQDDADGRSLGVTGTPTFFINGVKKDGARSLQDLAVIIDPMLEKLGK